MAAVTSVAKARGVEKLLLLRYLLLALHSNTVMLYETAIFSQFRETQSMSIIRPNESPRFINFVPSFNLPHEKVVRFALEKYLS